MTVLRPYNSYGLASGLVRTWFRQFNDFEVAGAEHLPAQGAYLLASNHASFIDPPLMAAAVPVNRQIYFFARKSLFKGAFGRLITTLHAVPIDRDADGDLAAFRRVFELLKRGEALLVFPEGTRTTDGEIGPAEKGVGMIACRANVPIVPARIFGSFAYWGRQQRLPRLSSPLAVTFGAPFTVASVDPGRREQDRYGVVAERTLEAIRALPPPGGYVGADVTTGSAKK